MKTPVATRNRVLRVRRRGGRRGAILVWFALLLTLLMGMLGLVVDGGLLMAGHRQAQNAADAAAIAAAFDLMYGLTETKAIETATHFVRQYNALTDAGVEVHIPPVTGPYTEMDGYVEVIVTSPSQTFFIHILTGAGAEQEVRARAVAGFEAISSGEGVAVLRPDATPGLSVSNNARLVVDGRVIVNSEGGGIDENGVPVEGDQVAADGGNPSEGNGVYARDIRIVGGVNRVDSFRNYDYPDDPTNVLFCRQSPIPDPLRDLPVPTTATGVLDIKRGSASVTSQGASLNDEAGENRLEAGIVYLYPGIYRTIDIQGGHVIFAPGIYVLAPTANVTTALKVTGGTVMGNGIMFYNTGNSYTAGDGTPDVTDGDKPPPGKISDLNDETAYWGGFNITSSVNLSPINTNDPNLDYGAAHPDISTFNGMLFFQRRRNGSGLSVTGDAADGLLAGTLYAKWSHVSISGQGTYSAQFVVGSMSLSGQADVTLQYAGQNLGRAPQVVLVE